jgi:tetratricopeptide (TPR) repeat protein
MRKNNYRLLALAACTAVFIFYACSTGNKNQENKLGAITYAATGKKEAQPDYQKGLLLLHSFEYVDAAIEFRKARKKDPAFVMTYWGEAMTYNHTLWRDQDYEKATAVLNALAPTPEERVARAATEIEKDFMRSINILYGKGSKEHRDSAYAAFFTSLHQKYPGNNEVTAFYSLALLGSVPVGRDTKTYELAADMAKEVLQSNPKHPGALHYLIHAYDDPSHAALAISTADLYSVTAPDAGHALHMPSHIYLAMGMWDKVISSNIASWEASLNRKQRNNYGNNALNYHAYYWLMYGYLQKGNTSTSKQIVDSMYSFCSALSSVNARTYMIGQKATYLVETNSYGSALNDIEVKQDDLDIVTRSANYYVNAMNLYLKRDAEKLHATINKLEGAILIEKEKVETTGGRLCGNVNGTIPNELDIQQATVVLLELKSAEAQLNNKVQEAEKYLKEAIALENNISYAYGPPTIVKPSPEMYADWLLEANRPTEAIQQYQQALKAAPNRLLSLQGIKKAKAMQGTAANF